MVHTDSLDTRITAHYPQLSSTGQTIANYLQSHPQALLSLSVAELAKQTNTSKATVSRFFRQLGYESHQQAKNATLARRADGFPVHAGDTGVDNDVTQELTLIKQTFEGLNEQALAAVVSKLAAARRVVLIGYRNSFPVALHFRQQLKQARGNVHLYPQSGQTIAEDLIDLNRDDLVVILGFRRRPRIFNTLIESLKNCDTVLLTDPSGQVYNQAVSTLFVCQLGSTQALDSYASPMALVSLLANRVYQHLGESAQRRASAISERYDEYGELS